MSLKKKFFEFALWLSVSLLFILVVYQVLIITHPDLPELEFIVYIFLVPYLLNLVVYALILKGITLGPQYVVQIIILSIVLKLILFGAFNFAMIYFSRDSAFPSVIGFFVVYLITTILEIGMLIPLINGKERLENDTTESV